MAQEVLLLPFFTEKIPAGDVLIFNMFLLEELENQIDQLNSKIRNENKQIRELSELMSEIPGYKIRKVDSAPADNPQDMAAAGAAENGEYVIGGTIKPVGSAYIVDAWLVRTAGGKVISRDRRLIAGLGELTAASGLLSKSLLQDGESILQYYRDFKEGVLAETDRSDVRDTGEVLTAEGVAFKGRFSIIKSGAKIKQEQDDEKIFDPNSPIKLISGIGTSSIQTASSVIGVLSREIYIESDLAWDRYNWNPADPQTYIDYEKKVDLGNTLFLTHIGSFYGGTLLDLGVDIFSSSSYFSYNDRGKLFMALGIGLDAAGEAALNFSSNYGLESRCRLYEATTGIIGNTEQAYQSFETDQLMRNLLLYSGLGLKAASLTFKILAEYSPEMVKRGFWNKALYLGGGILSGAGTAFSWGVFMAHQEAAQAYLNYISGSPPAADEFDNFYHFYNNEYIPTFLIATSALIVGGALQVLSFYVPGSKMVDLELENSLTELSISGAGGYITINISM